MPRKYSTTRLAKLNQRIKMLVSENSEHEEDEDDEFENEQNENTEMEDEWAPSNRTLNYTAHCSYPILNLGLGQNAVSDRPKYLFPQCGVTVPLPVYVSCQKTPFVEPCHKRPVAHDEWIDSLNICRSKYLKLASNQKQREKKEKHRVHNWRLFELAEMIAKQENTYFRDSYDYYYSGGNLNILSYKSEESAGAPKPLALHISGEDLRSINLSEVGKEAELWHPLHSQTLSDVSSEIFELLPIESFRVNHGNMFLARMLNNSAIYELKEVDEEGDCDGDEEGADAKRKYELNCHYKYFSEDGPLISVVQAVNSPNTLGIACQDRTVRFNDIETGQDISKHAVSVLKGVHKYSTFAQLRASQEHCFHYVCQSAVLTIDMRCPNAAINPCFASSTYSKYCETFSCLRHSVNPNLLYVASNHKLHCLDMRSMGRKVSDRSVVTWTHQMSYSPMFMDVIDHEGSEFVALGSSLPSDQRICELRGARSESVQDMWSGALPYYPVQLEEALLDTQIQGSIVNVYADLWERVKSCITGIKFQRVNKAIDGAFAQLLLASTVGDIFCQRFTMRDELEMLDEMRTGPHTREVIQYYAALVLNCISRKLRCTSVQCVPVMREVMLSPEERFVEEEVPPIVEYAAIDFEFSDSESEHNPHGSEQPQQTPAPATPKEPTGEEPPKKRAVNRGPWQKSAYNLSQYKDLISTRLLSIWDVNEFDLGRDVDISMIDDKVKDENGVEARTELWLKETVRQAEILAEAEVPDNSAKYVQGTDMPLYLGAATADYREVLSDVADNLTDIKNDEPHSMLTGKRYTDMPETSRPAKKPKTKHVKGF